MTGWDTTKLTVYVISFKSNNTPHMIVDKKESAEEYCKEHPQYDWDAWGVQTKHRQKQIPIKRKKPLILANLNQRTKKGKRSA